MDVTPVEGKMRTGTMLKIRFGRRRAAAKTAVLNVAREKDCAMFIKRQDLSAYVEQLNSAQRAQMQATRECAEAVLAKPSMSIEALRARARCAAQWENDNGAVSAFTGIRR